MEILKRWFGPKYKEVYIRAQKCLVCDGSMATGQPVLKSSGMCPTCHYDDEKANKWAMENIINGFAKVEEDMCTKALTISTTPDSMKNVVTITPSGDEDQIIIIGEWVSEIRDGETILTKEGTR